MAAASKATSAAAPLCPCAVLGRVFLVLIPMVLPAQSSWAAASPCWGEGQELDWILQSPQGGVYFSLVVAV